MSDLELRGDVEKRVLDQNSFEFWNFGLSVRKIGSEGQKLRVHFELKMHFSALFVFKTMIFDTKKNGLK